MQAKKPIIYLALLGSMIFWAISFVWIKVVYQAYGPLTTVIFRLIIATIIMLIFSKLTRKLMPVKREDIRAFLLLAFFEPFLYFMGESFGLKYVSSTVGAVVVATIPLFSPIAAKRYHGERLTLRNTIGIIISFLGVALVVFDHNTNLKASTIGVLLELVAVGAAIGYSVMLKTLAFKYNPTTIITYQNLIGIFYFLPFFLVFEMKDFSTTPFSADAFTAIAKLAIFASCLAFILFTYCVKDLGMNNANMFINLIPVFTAIFAWYILGDTLSIQKITGITVVISGLFIAQYRRRKMALNN